MSNSPEKATHIIFECQKWLEKSSNPLISSNKKLNRRFLRSKSELGHIENALTSNMSIATYGASQSGKSYLVAALAKGGNDKLLTKIGNDKFDFIKLINPEGGQESTGLVTRFTTKEINVPNFEFPIKVKLFNITDIIKILANSFFYDVAFPDNIVLEDEQKNINNVLTELENKEPTKSDKFDFEFISVEQLEDLEFYCENKFQANIFYQAMKRANYWDRLESIVLSDTRENSITVLSYLWGSLERYNKIFSLLINTIDQLQGSEIVYCKLDSLLEKGDKIWKRKKNSIINVASLISWDTSPSTFIEIYLDKNTIISASSTLISSLATEISFQILDPGHDFFNEADLLDFPGARSRKMQSRSSFLSEPDLPTENFLRGKVAYLFDKYVSEYDISGMLLCVGPGNQDTVGLDHLIEDWVSKSHGRRPEDRSKVLCSLFVILTKFDVEFRNSSGVEIGPLRWETRLCASLEEPFGTKRSSLTDWVDNWNLNGNFNNVFWLRNPNADQSNIIDYEGESGRSSEISFRKEQESFISELKSSFIQSGAGKKYFKNPKLAWEEAVKLNDGGANYILAELNKIANRNNRDLQLREASIKILHDRYVDIKSYLLPDAPDEIYLHQQQLVKSFIKIFNKLLVLERLGEFIALLQVSDENVAYIFESARAEIDKKKTSKRKPDEPKKNEIPLDPFLARMMGERIETEGSLLSDSTNEHYHSKILVEGLIDSWVDKVSTSLSNASLADYLHIEREFIVSFLNELRVYIYNSGFSEVLSSLVFEASKIRTGHEKYWVWKQASIFTANFNNFIDCGGFWDKEPYTVRYLDGTEAIVFDTKLVETNLNIIDDKKDNYGKKYFFDWISAVHHNIMSNANISKMSHQQRTENQQLTSLLDELSSFIKSMEA